MLAFVVVFPFCDSLLLLKGLHLLLVTGCGASSPVDLVFSWYIFWMLGFFLHCNSAYVGLGYVVFFFIYLHLCVGRGDRIDGRK